MGIETPKSRDQENKEEGTTRRSFLKAAALGALGALVPKLTEAAESKEDAEMEEWKKVVGRAWTEAVASWNDKSAPQETKEKKFKDAAILDAWSAVFNAKAHYAINKTQEKGLIEGVINAAIRQLAGRITALEGKQVSVDPSLDPKKEAFVVGTNRVVTFRETRRAMDEMNASLLEVCSAKTGKECQVQDLSEFQKYLFSKESSKIFLNMFARG